MVMSMRMVMRIEMKRKMSYAIDDFHKVKCNSECRDKR